MIAGVVAVMASVAWANDSATHITETDVIRVEIGEVVPVRKYDQASTVSVQIVNQSDTEIAGTLKIGGPTKGLYPIGKTNRDFHLLPGKELMADFEVAFSKESLTGVFYPVHAFVQLTDGRDARVQLVRLIETQFENPEPRPTPETPIRVGFQPGDRSSLGPFAQARLNLLTSFIRRSEELPTGVLAFRLGKEKDSLSLAIRPGKAGFLDAEIAIIGANEVLAFHGLELELELPPGVGEEDVDPKLEVVEASVDATDNGFTATHQLRAGDDWTSQIVVNGLVRNGTLELRLESIDRVARFRLGESSHEIRGLAAGPGYAFEGAGPNAKPGSPLLAASFVGVEYEANIAVVQSTDLPILSLQEGRIEVRGDAALSLTATAGSMYAAAVRFANGQPDVDAELDEKVVDLSGRLWIQASRGKFTDLKARLEELKLYGVRNIALCLDGWRRHGGSRPPDSWPPNEELGALADLQELANYCRQNNILFGLEEAYSQIHPAADDFNYESLSFDANGNPLKDSNGHYLLRSDALRPYLERNLKFQRYYLVPQLGITGGARLVSTRDRNGAVRSLAETTADWRETLEFVGNYFGPESISVARNAGDWAIGAAAGSSFDPVEAAGSIRTPWLSLKSHHKLVQFEAIDEPNHNTNITNEVLLGRAPFVGDYGWGRAAVRKAWLVQPIAQLLAGQRITRISFAENNRTRVRCYWSNDALVWANHDTESWTIAGRVLAPGGFLVRTPNLEVSIEERDGQIVERLESEDRWYANASTRLPSLLRARPFVEYAVIREEELQLKLGWIFAEDPPEDFATHVLASADNRAIAEIPAAETSRDLRDDGSVRLIRYEVKLPLEGLPADMEIDVVALNHDMRPIRTLLSDVDKVSGRYAGFSVPTGKVTSSDQTSFTAAPNIDSQPGGMQLASKARMIDFGFVRTDGAFQIRRAPDGIRITPLPDSAGFTAELNLKELGIEQPITAVAARDRKTADWWEHPHEVADGVLTIKHNPKAFTYAVMVESAAAGAEKIETPEKSNSPPPPANPGIRAKPINPSLNPE